MNLNVYVWWCVALVNLNPYVNSLIFFLEECSTEKAGHQNIEKSDH